MVTSGAAEVLYAGGTLSDVTLFAGAALELAGLSITSTFGAGYRCSHDSRHRRVRRASNRRLRVLDDQQLYASARCGSALIRRPNGTLWLIVCNLI